MKLKINYAGYGVSAGVKIVRYVIKPSDMLSKIHINRVMIAGLRDKLKIHFPEFYF